MPTEGDPRPGHYESERYKRERSTGELQGRGFEGRKVKKKEKVRGGGEKGEETKRKEGKV